MHFFSVFNFLSALHAWMHCCLLLSSVIIHKCDHVGYMLLYRVARNAIYVHLCPFATMLDYADNHQHVMARNEQFMCTFPHLLLCFVYAGNPQIVHVFLVAAVLFIHQGTSSILSCCSICGAYRCGIQIQSRYQQCVYQVGII